MELTVGAIKPSSVALGQSEAILREISANGFSILDKRVISLSLEQALKIYNNKANLQDLIVYSASGNWLFFLAEGAAAIERLHVLKGTTPLADRPPRGLRGKFGISRIENAVHAVENEDEYRRHILEFFPNIQILTKKRRPLVFSVTGEKIGVHGIVRDNRNGSFSKLSTYSDGEFPDFLYREFLLLNSIFELGISPKPLYYYTERMGVDELVMEFVPGVHFGDLSREEKIFLLPEVTKKLKLLHQETSIQGTFESMGEEKYGNYVECFEDNVEILRAFAKKFDFDEAILFLEKTREPLCSLFTKRHCRRPGKFSLIHFDISGGNVIVGEKRIIFVDWGSAHLNDPAWDISRAIVKLTDGSEKSISIFLENYGTSDELRERVFAYLPLAYLSIAIGRSKTEGNLPKRAALRNMDHKALLNLAVLQYKKSIRYG